MKQFGELKFLIRIISAKFRELNIKSSFAIENGMERMKMHSKIINLGFCINQTVQCAIALPSSKYAVHKIEAKKNTFRKKCEILTRSELLTLQCTRLT